MILYEYPLNEGVRTLLRLETLFDRLGQLLGRTDALDHHFALSTLFELMEVAGRADLKADLLKDLERQRMHFNAFRGNPAIAESVLNEVLGSLDEAFEQLNTMPGRAGHALTQNDWLMTLRSRIAIPGGTCEFDLPSYHAWLHTPAEQRLSDLNGWTESFRPVAQAMTLLMGLMRDTGKPQRALAAGGQFQQALPAGRAYHLVRLRMDPAAGLVPEITGHRLLVTVRMMRVEPEQRVKPSTEDTPFELTLCT